MGKDYAWVIYSGDGATRNKAFVSMLEEELGKHGIALRLLIAEKIRLFFKDSAPVLEYACRIPDKPLFVINRTSSSFLARHIECMGLRVFNSSAVNELCNNKFLTHLHFSKTGVPFLNTRLLADDPEPALDFPFVIKPVDGRGGEGVSLVTCADQYKTARAALAGRTCVAQELSGVPGKDVRVYVVGKRIAAAMLRESAGGFKSNYCLGGHASVYYLSEYEAFMVNKIIGSMDFDFVGIDFLFHNGGIVFNEIEDPVGSRMLYDLTDTHIVSIFVDYIIGRL